MRRITFTLLASIMVLLATGPGRAESKLLTGNDLLEMCEDRAPTSDGYPSVSATSWASST
jgi:hypothetical protein